MKNNTKLLTGLELSEKVKTGFFSFMAVSPMPFNVTITSKETTILITLSDNKTTRVLEFPNKSSSGETEREWGFLLGVYLQEAIAPINAKDAKRNKVQDVWPLRLDRSKVGTRR